MKITGSLVLAAILFLTVLSVLSVLPWNRGLKFRGRDLDQWIKRLSDRDGYAETMREIFAALRAADRDEARWAFIILSKARLTHNDEAEAVPIVRLALQGRDPRILRPAVAAINAFNRRGHSFVNDLVAILEKALTVSETNLKATPDIENFQEIGIYCAGSVDDPVVFDTLLIVECIQALRRIGRDAAGARQVLQRIRDKQWAFAGSRLLSQFQKRASRDATEALKQIEAP